MKRRGADWETIKYEYITSGLTLRELSDRHGVSLKSIGLKASAEDWKSERDAHLVKVSRKAVQKAVAKAGEKHAVEMAGWQSKVTTAANKALDGLLAQSEQVKEYPPSMAQAWLAALDKAMKIIREMDGYIPPTDQAKIDLARAELEIKKEEHARLMAEASSTREPITITLDGDMEKYSK